MSSKLIYATDRTAFLKPTYNEGLEIILLNISCGCWNAEMALAVWRRDIEVDHMHTAFHKEVLAPMSRNPNMVGTGAHLLFIAKNIERIGDYATGIAEQVHFLVEGAMPDEDRPKADKTSKVVGT